MFPFMVAYKLVYPQFARRMVLTTLVVLLAGSALILLPSSGQAGFYTLTVSGLDADKETVNATVDITTQSGKIIIKLTNNVGGASMDSVGQAISALEFTLSAAPTSALTGADSNPSASGQLITVDSTGKVSKTSDTTDVNAWENNLTSLSGNTFKMSELSATGSGKPLNMILGNPDSNGYYPNANTSITKSSAPLTFQPFYEGSATFTLNAPGVTSNTSITSASIGFGTGPDFFLGNGPSAQVVPQPPGVVLGAIGFAMMSFAGLLGRRRPKLAPVA
jgi:hypothetical protein